jgi:hypothetical protein
MEKLGFSQFMENTVSLLKYKAARLRRLASEYGTVDKQSCSDQRRLYVSWSFTSLLAYLCPGLVAETCKGERTKRGANPFLPTRVDFVVVENNTRVDLIDCSTTSDRNRALYTLHFERFHFMLGF